MKFYVSPAHLHNRGAWIVNDNRLYYLADYKAAPFANIKRRSDENHSKPFLPTKYGRNESATQRGHYSSCHVAAPALGGLQRGPCKVYGPYVVTTRKPISLSRSTLSRGTDSLRAPEPTRSDLGPSPQDIPRRPRGLQSSGPDEKLDLISAGMFMQSLVHCVTLPDISKKPNAFGGKASTGAVKR